MQFLRLALLLLAVVLTAAITEPKTGVDFPHKFKGSSLSKVGVRSKGPIKIYAVGQYGKTFLLQMTYGASASKMTSALKAAMQSRCRDANKVNEFECLMLKGLPSGAPKGTKIAFQTAGGKLSLSVNGRGVGSIESKPLASALAGIYTDGNAVCKLNPVSK
jgi:hypothetical protein